ncbi:hypothetical protein TNIN_65251 [Trichonephila inaurata madagascariensis]|uniref:Uncharacterized protein n=1 Tax=Trichonephila inaurata madagascariensis TaxID=2747483 RepID=A0A8X6XEG6_9ARAC|nr:hypothetical protein TNIN_65251 [Trichonephila inaurata madagascariensis]
MKEDNNESSLCKCQILRFSFGFWKRLTSSQTLIRISNTRREEKAPTNGPSCQETGEVFDLSAFFKRYNTFWEKDPNRVTPVVRHIKRTHHEIRERSAVCILF